MPKKIFSLPRFCVGSTCSMAANSASGSGRFSSITGDDTPQTNEIRLLNVQAEAYSRFCDQQRGIGWVCLQFAPQCSHIDAQILDLALVLRPPHLTQELTMCDHFAGVLDEHEIGRASCREDGR